MENQMPLTDFAGDNVAVLKNYGFVPAPFSVSYYAGFCIKNTWPGAISIGTQVISEIFGKKSNPEILVLSKF
jgi:hypothetical protein